jgi:uncharacterized Zn-binding protein involved in type VI secretion
MGQPAAKQGDLVIAFDTHVEVQSSGVAGPDLLPFSGPLSGGLSTDVQITGLAAAVVGTTAVNQVPHLPVPGSIFSCPPMNQGTTQGGSATVLINGKPAARAGDPAKTCNDVPGVPPGRIQAGGQVLIG